MSVISDRFPIRTLDVFVHTRRGFTPFRETLQAWKLEPPFLLKINIKRTTCINMRVYAITKVNTGILMLEGFRVRGYVRCRDM